MGLAERVKPVLFVNKVDRCILELQMEPEDMYTRFRKAIEDVNVIVATYNDELMGDQQLAPEKGTVAFGSGLHGWGFNVERFAKIYAAKMGVDKEKMMKRLWGDSFFNAKKKTWTNVMEPEGSDKPLPRAFCQFIMTPINQLMRAIMDDQKEKYEKMMGTLGIVLKGDDRQLTGKPLMKRTMQIWINAADTLLSMIVTKLPNPRVAQKYRVENLYEGPMDDEAACAIRVCDEDGSNPGQGALLRFRTCLQWNHRHRAEGPNPGTPLQGWRQRGPQHQEHPADCPHDGPHHRANPGCALRKHRGPRWRRPVHFEVRHIDHSGHGAQHCGHEVQRLSGCQGGCQGEGRKGVAEACRRTEEAVEVGSVGGLHHRGERRARHCRLWRAPCRNLLEGLARGVRPVRVHRV